MTYTSNTWVTGGTFNAGSANAWESRIASAFSDDASTMAGNAANIATHETRLDAFDDLIPTLPFSPNTAAAQAGSTYTFALTDAGTALISPATGANVWTVPTNASVAFPTGSIIVVMNASSTSLTIAAAGGVTIRNRSLVMSTQYTKGVLHKSATNLWWFNGEVG